MSIDPALEPASAEHAAATRSVTDWLAAVAEQHDLSLAPPDDERATALVALLGVLSQEFAEYRDVVAGAREAARTNGSLLAGVVHSTRDAGGLVHATAVAVTQAASGAEQMAQAGAALCDFTGTAVGAAKGAGTSLASIAAALAELDAGLTAGNDPLAEMRRSVTGIAGFVVTLARLSRHAQLLAVNASIEAAHVDGAGSRFGIVAQEVRKLSVSTRESKAGVAHIVAELREATERVAASASDSQAVTAAARGEVAGANEALARTAGGIGEFEQMVATVADVAATQQMALDAIGGSVGEIAQEADAAAGASGDAARLDLDALLERAQTRAARWTLGPSTPSAASGCGSGEFALWVAAIAGGADPAAASAIDADAELQPLVSAVRHLLAQIDAQGRDILASVVDVALAVSRNSYAWVAIARSLDHVRDEVSIVRETTVEAARVAQACADIAAGMQALVETIRGRYATALTLLDGALARTGRIGGSVREIDGFVESMNAAAARADHIVALIETLSSETDLLSLNAAIEAAHAGELGEGFGVIAEEIRALARSTTDSTLSIADLVAAIAGISGNLQASIGAAATSMNDVVRNAADVRAALAILHTAFESALTRTHEVSATAAEQTRALDRVLENINRSSSALEANAGGGSEHGRLELAMLGSRAHAIAARRPIGTVAAQVRTLAEKLCTRLEATLESGLGQGRFTLEQLLTLRYEPIAGNAVSALGRLFDVERVPPAGFEPAKYATPWDGLVDEAMIDVLTQGWEEAGAAGLSPVALFVSDLNGFFYAYPRQKIAAWTNDPATDGPGNRIKRLFEDDYTLRVGRCGLGPPAAQIGPRASYETLRSAGCELRRPADRPWGGFVYARDTSMVCNEIVMGIYARDLRHSTLRVCYDPNLI